MVAGLQVQYNILCNKTTFNKNCAKRVLEGLKVLQQCRETRPRTPAVLVISDVMITSAPVSACKTTAVEFWKAVYAPN